MLFELLRILTEALLVAAVVVLAFVAISDLATMNDLPSILFTSQGLTALGILLLASFLFVAWIDSRGDD